MLGEGRVAEADGLVHRAAEGRRTARAVLRGAGSGPHPPPAGRAGRRSVPAVLDMLRDNADKDAYLRHAGVMALVGSGDQATPGWRRPTTPRRPCAWPCCWPCGGRTTRRWPASSTTPIRCWWWRRRGRSTTRRSTRPRRKLAALVQRPGLSDAAGLPRPQRQLPAGRQGERRGRGRLRRPRRRSGDVADRGPQANWPTGRSRRAATA